MVKNRALLSDMSTIGILRAVVTDGVTLGHPCCGEHNCPNPLVNNRRRFCKAHAHRETECTIKGCSQPVGHGPNRLCCDISEHRDQDIQHAELNASLRLLARRLLDHTKKHDPQDEGQGAEEAVSAALEMVDVLQAEEDPVLKSDEGNRTTKAQWGRKATHNEQLVVYSCGMIAARATMFGAEAITGVKVS